MEPNAHPLRRILASLIDQSIFLVIVALLAVYVTSAISVVELLQKLITAITFLFVYLTCVPLFASYLTHSFGGTIGKLAAGIEVVNEKNKRLSFPLAFFRQTAGYTVSSLFFGLGFLWVFKKERQTWHDLLTQTRVRISYTRGTAVGLFILAVLAALLIFLGQRIALQFAAQQMVRDEIQTEVKQTINTLLKTKPTTEMEKFDLETPLLF